MRRRRRVIVIITSILVAIVVIGTAAYGYVRYRYDQIQQLNVNGLNSATSSSQPENILLVGDNSRCTLTKYSSFYKTHKQNFGSCSQVGGGRSDVTMILHVNPAQHQAYLLSIPRDLWLPMPGGNGLQLRVDDSLNAAETSYLHLPFGPTLLVKAIEQDLGIPINHYVELNFYTFEQVVNTLGGVTIDFPTKLVDHYSGLNITHPGCQHLNGSQALALVRARHLYYYDPATGSWNYDGTGDLGRIQRTHIFLRVLATQVKSSALSNPLQANALLGSVIPSLKVDKGFTLSSMVSLALAFQHVNPAAIPSATLPVIIPSSPFRDNANPSNYQAPGSIVLPFQPQDLKLVTTFLGSSAPQYAKISPHSVSLSVLNGSGVSGQAATTAAQFTRLGFRVVSTGNATYAGTDSETVVSYKPGDLAQAEKVLSEISGQAIMAEGSANQGADIVVTTGSTFSIAAPATAASSPATATSSSSPPATGTAGSSGASQATPAASVAQTAANGLWTATHQAPWWDPKACPAK